MMSPENIRRTIQSTIHRYLPANQVDIYLFGSRADGMATRVSDYDIALDSGQRIDGAILTQIRDDLEESRSVDP